MSRPIKFRAAAKDDQGTTYLVYEIEGKRSAGQLLDRAEEEGWKVMQFTGLLDKNGKEVYEGDIVMWSEWKLGSKDLSGKERQPSAINEVEWNQGAWQFKGDSGFNIALYDNMEVIGNIWEHPELLVNKGSKDEKRVVNNLTLS